MIRKGVTVSLCGRHLLELPTRIGGCDGRKRARNKRVKWSACRLKPTGRPQHKAPPSPPPRHIVSGSNIGESQCDRRFLDSRVVVMALLRCMGYRATCLSEAWMFSSASPVTRDSSAKFIRMGRLDSGL